MTRTLPAILLALALSGAAHPPIVRALHVRPNPTAPLAYHPAVPIPAARPPMPAVLRTLAPWMAAFSRQARATGVPQAALEAVALTESGGNPSAVSPAGAVGIMQVEPATGRAMGVWGLLSPVASITAGSRYLAYLGGRFGVTAACWSAGPEARGACTGRIARVLSAYAAGPSGGAQPWYVRRVERAWREVLAA